MGNNFYVVLSCANLATAEIVKAEIKHTLGYDADIDEKKDLRARYGSK